MDVIKNNNKQMRLIFLGDKPTEQEKFGMMSDTEFVFQKLCVFIYITLLESFKSCSAII